MTKRLEYTHNGIDVTIDAILNTGYVVDDNGNTVTTHSLHVFYTGVDSRIDGLTFDTIAQASNQLVIDTNGYIDGLSDPSLDKLLTDLGYDDNLTTLATPSLVLTAGTPSSTQINATVGVVANATSYRVDLAETQTFETIYMTQGLTVLAGSVTFGSLTPDSRYYIRTYALADDYGQSAYAYDDLTTSP